MKYEYESVFFFFLWKCFINSGALKVWKHFSEIMEIIMLSADQLFWLIKIGPQRLCTCQYFIHWVNKYWLYTYFLPGTGDSAVNKILKILSNPSLPCILLFFKSIHFFFFLNQWCVPLISICLSPNKCKNLTNFLLDLIILIMEGRYEKKDMR